jgi:hypothetical protein
LCDGVTILDYKIIRSESVDDERLLTRVSVRLVGSLDLLVELDSETEDLGGGVGVMSHHQWWWWYPKLVFGGTGAAGRTRRGKVAKEVEWAADQRLIHNIYLDIY